MSPAPTPSPFTRRRLLELGGLGLGAAFLAGCSSPETPAPPPPAPGDDLWRRFDGTTINFISENTAPTAAIAANLRPFTELTGVTVNIVSLELQSLVQRVALDMAGGRAQYDVVYADP
jgi:multiple sugar transport system substrate-binding protein